MARGATKVAWYSPCISWSSDGVIGRSVGGGKLWLVGWLCGRGFCGFIFVKGVLLGYLDRILLGRVNGCELGASDGVLLGNFDLTPAG